MKKKMESIIKETILILQAEKIWPVFDMPEIEVTAPQNEKFGDYATNIAMVLAPVLGKKPMEIAEQLRDVIASEAKQSRNNTTSELKKGIAASPSAPRNDSNLFEKIEAVAPGYINFYLSEKYLHRTVAEINRDEQKYGNSNSGKGIKVNNEFISANPTGPLHLGNGRGGFYGDVLSNVLAKAGYKVRKEYYVNDVGEQVIKLGHSVLKDKDAVYAGAYIDALNKKFGMLKDAKKAGEKAAKIVMDKIVKKTINEIMGIKFDKWVSEKNDILDQNYVNKAMGILQKKKLVYRKEEALWLETTKFGDDKDRVLVKGNGEKTYFASDCGYLLYKIKNKFDRIIEIWGADHHGYIKRFEAAARALGFKGDLRFIIIQLVRLVEKGKEVRMSKRAGNVVYIDELIDEVGLDVTRFFFLLYSPDTHMNFDLGLAKERSEKNPVYYVQYAHARICSVIRKFVISNSEQKDKNIQITNYQLPITKANLSLLSHEKELSLIKELNKFPELIEEISQSYEVHKLPHYAIKLADKFHNFYESCRVIDEKNPKLTNARLILINAVRIVLAETLRLMGVKAPNKM